MSIRPREETRLVVVGPNGKLCEHWNVEITESVQDDGRTLKIFFKEKEKEKMIEPNKCSRCSNTKSYRGFTKWPTSYHVLGFKCNVCDYINCYVKKRGVVKNKEE
jgi:hypothetical protein